MMMKRSLNLWVALIITVFLVMLSSSTIIFFTIFLLVRLGIFRPSIQNPLFPTLFFLLISVAIGTGITIVIGKRILTPITDFIEAMKKVAKGDFTVELDETHKIYELTEMAINFNIMVRELSSIETLRNDFVVNVSHEFKTPIATIEGCATLIKGSDLTNSEHDEYTQMIIENTQQLSALSSNILKISKLENQELIAEKNSFRLDEQIRQALLLLEIQWSNKGISLNIELTSVVFYGNEELMMQIWMNLLGNAIKFTPDGGEISVSLVESMDCVIIKIVDTGIGMEREAQKHIFEKFYQEDKSRASDGNGLGLPLIKRIVDLCGGNINVESQLGKGSSFVVTLPRNDSNGSRY